MIFETYTCSMDNCMVEYGFTFKENEETEDTIFDLVLGTIKGTDADFIAKVEKDWMDNEKYARAVCAADAGEKV